MAELRYLAIHCDYKEALINTLQDIFICEVNDSSIQQRLLSDADFKKALEIALVMETAEKDAKDLKGEDTSPMDVSVIKPQHIYRGED